MKIIRLIVPVALACSCAVFSRADTVVPAQTVASGKLLQVQSSGAVETVTAATVAVEIQPGGTAIFRSATKVTLKPGFKATAGAFFHSASALAAGVPLAWRYQAGIDHYDIYRNGINIGTTAGHTFTDTGAVAGQNNTYTIKSVTAAGVQAVVATYTAIAPLTFEVFTPLSP